jgi:hypothetical protein
MGGRLSLVPGPEGRNIHVFPRFRLVALLPPERTLSWTGSVQTQ